MQDYYYDLGQMNFDLSPEQLRFLSEVNLACLTIRDYEDKCYLEEKFNDRIIPEFSKIGMLGCPVSREYGGLGYDMLTYSLAMERIGEEGASLRTFFSAHTSIGQLVLQSWANEEQKKKYLPNTTNGKSIMCFALTEPEAGSDPSRMTTKFETKENKYILNGKKHWIGNGTFANIMTTFAKDPETGEISAFIVERSSPGIRIEEMKNKIGLSTVKNAVIYFDNCSIPKDNLLGKEGQGLSVAYSALIDGRLSVAAGALGIMKDCLRESVRYAKMREQHGSVLAKKQLIQEHIANMAVSIESSRWLVYRAAYARQIMHTYVENLKKEHGDWQSKLARSNKEYCDLREQADLLAAIAKLHSSNCAFDAANRSVQIFGSLGYQKTSRVARHFLDCRATTIYEGANEVLLLKIASKTLGAEFRAY
jgi:alkylation response protein AidB-like acyl-CoA dehydrogenase